MLRAERPLGLRPRAAASEWLLWLVVMAAATLLLLRFRRGIDEAHVALTYLLVVLGASARGGRPVGLSFAVLCFLCFNFFFLPPYYALTVHNPIDWFVLFSFLVTSAVAAQLLYRAEHAARLREADRLKDALLMSVSHDLRTPLTTIRALAQDIAAEGDERAGVVMEEADRLNRFVSDLLDLSRLNAGELPVNAELVAAEDVLGAALQRISGVAAGREVNASIDVAEPILVARLDFVHALRALVNLLDNALKYSAPEAPIDVTIARQEPHVAFVVADRGPGVPVELRDRIFDSFYRGDHSDDAGGTGLGLAIARRLAEAQGGEVRYAPRPGGGSVFTLLLPAATAAELESISL
jgi:K+-sensing histidine kinase KdpD